MADVIAYQSPVGYTGYCLVLSSFFVAAGLRPDRLDLEVYVMYGYY